MSKALPLTFVLIAMVLGLSYYHEATVTEVSDEVSTGFAAPVSEN